MKNVCGKISEWHRRGFLSLVPVVVSVTFSERTALGQRDMGSGSRGHIPRPECHKGNLFFHLLTALALVRPAARGRWLGRKGASLERARSMRGWRRVRGWLPSTKGPLTMVISRRGGGLCLILGDPMKRQDLISHMCRILQVKFLRGIPGKTCSVLYKTRHNVRTGLSELPRAFPREQLGQEGAAQTWLRKATDAALESFPGRAKV